MTTRTDTVPEAGPGPAPEASRASTARRRRRRPAWLPYLPYLLPGAVAFVVVIGYPFAMNVYYSLFKWRGGMAPMRWYGLGNYADLMHDSAFWTSFQNSISTSLCLPAGAALSGGSGTVRSGSSGGLPSATRCSAHAL